MIVYFWCENVTFSEALSTHSSSVETGCAVFLHHFPDELLVWFWHPQLKFVLLNSEETHLAHNGTN